MIYLYSDVLGDLGGIETYLHALAIKLHQECIPFRVVVSENGPARFLDDLIGRGIDVYRQSVVPGDRWQVRKRLLVLWLTRRLRAGDWVFCVRQPMPELYLKTVRAVHSCRARIAASWMFAPEFLRPPEHLAHSFNQAVEETDAVISVSRCSVHQFGEIYGYRGPVHVVNYHNLEVFSEPQPLPPTPPFRIGYMGRVEIVQKNLDTVLMAFGVLAARRSDVELHFYGGGPDEGQLKEMARHMNLSNQVFFHGAYDHRRDLGVIVSACHLFVHASRFEGGPCFSLLELLQAGRYVVTSPVGGIPDIYEGRPDVGLMVSPNDPTQIADALDEAVHKIAAAEIDPIAIRARYDDEFDMASAHRNWLLALDLAGQKTE